MKQLYSIVIVLLLAAGCAAQKTIPLTPIQPCKTAQQQAEACILHEAYMNGSITNWNNGQRKIVDGQEKIVYYLMFDFDKKDTIQTVSNAIAHKLQAALTTKTPVVITPLIRWTYTRDIPDEFYRAHGKELLRILSQEMYALCTNELPDSGLVFEYIVEDLPHIHRGHFAFTTERLDSTIDEALRTLTVQRCAACIDRLVQELL